MATVIGAGFIEMRISKVVGIRQAEDHASQYIVLDQAAGDAHLVIQVGSAEAFSLAAILGGIEWPRPMTYQFVAALVQGLGGRVHRVRIDRVVEGAYAGIVEVEGPLGAGRVDARSSDALNLASLVDAPILVAQDVLTDGERRLTGDSAEAASLRRALELPPMTINRGQPSGPAETV